MPDALDLDALAPWLADALGVTARPAVHRYPAGFSNLTYRLGLGDRSVVLRRPPPGAQATGGHDMAREFRILQALHGTVPVPEPLALEPTGSVLGAPFFVMAHVPGPILRATDPPLDASTMARVADAFVDTLAALHVVDVGAAGLTDLGRPEGYVRRQVEGWAARYAAAATDAVPDVDAALAWMATHAPPESGVALVHNDAKYDNLVLDPDSLADAEGPVRVRAVLDWELATVGDPRMDLGSSLGYWIEAGDPPALRAAALSPTWWPGNPTRAGLVDAYRQRTGRDVPHAVFYAVYGWVKLAVIAQQIYRRWTLGLTTDPRFEGLIHVVRACGRLAGDAIARDRISDLRS